MTPPILQGGALVAKKVRATSGTWTGGWGQPWGAYAYSEVTVCRSSEGKDCYALAFNRPIALESRWAGWYLFAAARFSSTHYTIPPPVPPPIYPHRIHLKDGLLTAHSAPSGPILVKAGLPAPPTATARLRPRALRRNHRLTLGSITCRVYCVAHVTVSGRGKTLGVDGTEAITIAPRRGLFEVTVEVAGKRLASRRVDKPDA